MKYKIYKAQSQKINIYTEKWQGDIKLKSVFNGELIRVKTYKGRDHDILKLRLEEYNYIRTLLQIALLQKNNNITLNTLSDEENIRHLNKINELVR